MKTVNRVTLLGNVGKNPEVRAAPSGSIIANFSIATTDRYKDKASGEWKESTDWTNVASFGKLAEIVRDYVHKGSPLYVEGKLRTRSYEKDGQKQYRTEVIADNIVLLGSGKPSERAVEAVEQEAEQDDLSIPF
jgi:single-strand DNA-binding protein